MKTISLKYQFSFWVALLVAAVITTISIYSLRHERESLVRQRMLHGKTLVRNLATASAEAILTGNELNIFSYCNDIIAHEEDAKQVIILDTKGQIIAHNETGLVGTHCNTTLCDSVLLWNSLHITPFQHQSDSLFDFSMPMVVLKKRVGSVRVVMSNQSILKRMAEIQSEIIRLSFMAVCIGILLSGILVHFMVKPITRLAEAAEVIGTGDFEHRIQIKNRSEIGELAATFNKMAERLLKRKHQISALNDAARVINTTHEMDSLLGETLKTISIILKPSQCMLCLFKEDTLVVCAASSSLQETLNKSAGIPAGIIDEIFVSPAARVYQFETLKEMPSLRNVQFDISGNEVVVAPLVYERARKGVMLLFGKQDGSVFSNTDKEFAGIIAASTAIAILNIELLKETAEKTRMAAELKTAEIVQKTLFPKHPVQTADIEVFGFFKSASETGGDWYGYIDDIANKRLSVFIGDVTGHGVPAALVTATANSFVRTIDLLKHRFEGFQRLSFNGSLETTALVSDPLAPAQLLNILNKIILSSADRQLAMTFFAATIDFSSKNVQFANAGHEMPIIIRDHGKARPQALAISGLRLGDTENTSYQQAETTLSSGDTLVLYTDGITDCENPEGEQYGNRRFLGKLRSSAMLGAKEMCDVVINDVFEFTQGKALADDVTLVVVRMV